MRHNQLFSIALLFVLYFNSPGTGKNNPYPEGKLGVIEPGAYADIILVDGNPLEDISVLGASFDMWASPRQSAEVDTIPLVMKNGSVYTNRLE